MAHDVFISYAQPDKHMADAVCAALEQHKIRCWIAPRDAIPGAHWASTLVQAIEDARIVVMVFTSASNKSRQVLSEVERAVHGGKVIIPFRTEDVPASRDLELFVSAPHWLDALDPPLEAHLEKLAMSIRLLLTPDDHGAQRPVIAPASHSPHQPTRSRATWYVAAAVAAVLVAIAAGLYLTPSSRLQLETPPDHAFVVGSRLELSWNAPIGPAPNQAFEVEIVAPDGSAHVERASGRQHLVGQPPAGALSWRVRVVDVSNGHETKGPWSETRQVNYFPDALSRIANTHIVRVGVPPLSDRGRFVRIEGTRLTGFEIELLRAILSRTLKIGPDELDLQWISAQDRSQFLNLLKTDPKVDLLAGGTSITEQRRLRYGFEFSLPTMTFPQSVVVKRGSSVLSAKGLLIARPLCAKRLTTNAERAIAMGAKESDLLFSEGSNSYAEMVDRVLNMNCVGALMDRPYAVEELARLGPKGQGLLVIDLPEPLERIGFVFRATDAALREVFDKDLEKEGESVARLRTRFFPEIVNGAQ